MMRKPVLVILAISAAIGLTGCSGVSEPTIAAMGGTETELPAWLEHQGELPLADLTQIAEVDDLVVFASHNSEGEWCAIAALAPTADDDGWAAGSSCAASALFAYEGITLSIAAYTRHARIRLLPDNFAGTIDDGWLRINDNLAIRE